MLNLWHCLTLKMSHKCCFKLFWFWRQLWKYKASRSSLQQAAPCPNNMTAYLTSGFLPWQTFVDFLRPYLPPKSHFWGYLQKSQHFQNSSYAGDIGKSKNQWAVIYETLWKTPGSWHPTSLMSLIYTLFPLLYLPAQTLSQTRKGVARVEMFDSWSLRSVCITLRTPAGFQISCSNQDSPLNMALISH